MSQRLKRIYNILVLFVLLVVPFIGKAQTNMAFYPIENQFNSSGFNPAFLYSDSQYSFSIFPIGGMNVGYNNQAVIKEITTNLIKNINQNTVYVDLAKTMVSGKSYNQKFESDLLSFTYRAPVGFFNFRIRENASITASLLGPVSGFMIKPEVKSVFLDHVQNIPILILHYREYSLGYSSNSDHHAIAWGFRGKIYFGKGVFKSEISGKISKIGNDYFLITKGKGKMLFPEAYVNSSSNNGSSSIISGSSLFNYFMNNGNIGLGFDLGFSYKINHKISVSLSTLDLGNIKWNNKKNRLISKDFTGNYMIPPTKIQPSTINGKNAIIKTKDQVSLDEVISKPYVRDFEQFPFSTTMPLTVYSGISYQLNPKVKLTLADRFIKVKNLNHNTLLASANFDLNDRLTVSTGYSIIGNSYFNLPLAVLYKGDFGQIYIGSDNFFSFLAPSVSEFSGITFGTCFYLFRKRDLYGEPNDHSPFHRPKKIKKVMNNGRIQKETTDFGFPEQY